MEHEDLNSITEAIIGCAFRVSNALGIGFLEKVYENAMVHELQKAGLNVQQQAPIKVIYDGVIVGEYVADLIVEGRILVELKVVRVLDEIHMAQCLNYLKATGIRLCLLMNFNESRVAVKRIAR
ncbi:MAG: GxxExxY protein [Phycisphaerae bacterium]|nr:GxxExxY protein [Phycisphaerae bacterium]